MIPIGRKGQYDEWLTEDGLTMIYGWAREGLTDEQIAHNIGVTGRTFSDWKARFPSISSTLKKGKAPVDIQVENALLKRAMGYTVTETVKEVYREGDTKNGKVISTHIKEITKEIPPDVGAIIFWLKNRRPGRWRDKIEAAPDNENELLASLMALERGKP